MKKLLLAVAAVAAFGAFGETYYVDGSVEASGDGSKDSPVKTVAEGVALAVNSGDIVEIAKGTYPIASIITISVPITLQGATGDPADVVIDAQGKTGVIRTTSTVAGTKILHLTARNGKGSTNNYGSNISLLGPATVSNCYVTAGVRDANSNGGGLYLTHANAFATHCKIWGNDISGGSGCGGGVYMTAGTVANCLITGNRVKKASGGLGGGVYMKGGTLRNCTIADNSGFKGGGLYFDYIGHKAYNCLVQRNSSGGAGNNIGAKYTVTDYISYCAWSDTSATSFGSTSVNLGDSIPFDEEYKLTKSGNDLVGGKGNPAQVVGTADFFGTPRPMEGGVVTSTDIGCAQYVPSEVKSVRFEASPLKGVGSTEVTFVATPDGGLDLETADCTWYLNGVPVEGEKGATMVKTLEPGFYSAKFTATDEDGTYTWEEPASKYISIMPTDVYVAPEGDGEAPYDEPEKATSNLLTVANTYLQSGVTLHIAAGKYPLKSSLSVTDGVKVYGAGFDKTVLYATGREYSVVAMNGTGAYMEGICVSNSAEAAGLDISGRGGHFTQGLIVKCTGRKNQAGGGATIADGSSKVSRTIIRNNQTYGTGGDNVGHKGGGVFLSNGGTLEDSLVVNNNADHSAGVYVEAGILRNCTIVGNHAFCKVRDADYTGCGGVLAHVTTGTSAIQNCILWGNRDDSATSAEDSSAQAGGANYFSYNCIQGKNGFGTHCVTGDPLFKDAANGDYRISAFGSCAYSGKYQSWMDGAVDFFGNPRATPGKKVSIGCCQAPDPGLMLLVR